MPIVTFIWEIEGFLRVKSFYSQRTNFLKLVTFLNLKKFSFPIVDETEKIVDPLTKWHLPIHVLSYHFDLWNSQTTSLRKCKTSVNVFFVNCVFSIWTQLLPSMVKGMIRVCVTFVQGPKIMEVFNCVNLFSEKIILKWLPETSCFAEPAWEVWSSISIKR